MSTYTVLESGTYLSLDRTASFFWTAGTVIPLDTAVRFGMPGAVAQRDAALRDRDRGQVIRRSDLEAYASGRRGRSFVALGDSSTRGGSSAGDTIPIQKAGGVWPTLFELTSLGRAELVANSAASGDTIQAVIDRLQAAVFDYKPDYAIILGLGTNEIGNGNTPASVIETMVKLWGALRAGGVEPVQCTLLPRGTASRVTAIAKANALLKLKAEQYRVRVVDVYPLQIDTTTGLALAGTTTDGATPAAAGQLLIAQAIDAATKDLFPAGEGEGWLVATKAANISLLANGVFIGDADANGLADSWEVSGTAGTFAYSLVAGSGDVKGN